MTHVVPSSAQDLLQHAYAAFNARDIAAALLSMHPDVVWPNGMEGGVVHGREEVRDYWTRQWDALDPHVEPVRIDADEDGQLIVAVHQIIRDLTGHVVSERFVEHAYVVEDGLIRRMEIRQTEPGATSRTSLRA